MIYTSRFYLRKFNINDADAMFNNWANDPEVSKYLTWNPHGDISVTKKYLEFLTNSNATDYAICVKETNEIIGAISNVKENADFSVCEIGYCLSRKYWNQGVISEVLDAYLNDLFSNKNYQVVEAEHMVENPASGAVMIKCGFRYNYTIEKLNDKFGWISVKHYSITKEEYLMHKLQLKLNDFLNTKVPLFATLYQTMNYMSKNGFLVNVIKTIENNKINYTESENILVIKKSDLNINTYYIIGKSKKKIEFDKFIEEFNLNNYDYLISSSFNSIEQDLVTLLKTNNLTISFAESCTGGLMASTLINVSGASDVIKESYVTYSKEAKIKILGVKKETLDEYSVYSKETAYEMAKGLSLISKANVSVSITGLAGGNSYNSSDGKFNSCIIINYDNQEHVINLFKDEKGSRNEVRKKQVNYVFYQIIKALKEIL
ncbi:MAG: nicotinamide-nucleotide amidohydrolase family protein [Bacilli bacterium]|nr:nicotinamide-nucleotide amidohydrolase family protein [Bacilli bacterium]